jgi:hypothetical protein
VINLLWNIKPNKKLKQRRITIMDKNKLNWIVFREIEQYVNKFSYKLPKGSLYNFWRNNQNELDFVDEIDTKMEFIGTQDRRLLSNEGFLKICVLHPALRKKIKELFESIFNIILKDSDIEEIELKISHNITSDNKQQWSLATTDYFNNQQYEVLINDITNEFGMTSEQLRYSIKLSISKRKY